MRTLFGLLLLALASGGCDGAGAAPPAPRRIASASTPVASSASVAAATDPPPGVTVRGVPLNTTALQLDSTLRKPDGAVIAKLRVEGEHATITLGERTITGKPRGGARRYDEAGRSCCMVKRRGARVRLRGPDGRVRFTATVFDGRIEITVDDAGYSIDRKGGVAVVEGPQGALGEVRLSAPAVVVDASGKPVFEGVAEGDSAAWGVALIDAIPEVERYVLMLEVATRGG